MAASELHVSHPERYRCVAAGAAPELDIELQALSDDIDDPALKLRYLRGALQEARPYDASVRLVPSAMLRHWFYRWLGLESFARQTSQPNVIAARNRARTWAAGAAATVVLLIIAVCVVAIQRYRDIHVALAAAKTPLATKAVASAIVPAVMAVPPSIVAEPLPEESLGVVPSTIWLADRGPGWELYSNGLRIEVSDVVIGKPRHFAIHRLSETRAATTLTKPVGILFHTSESDLWPLDAQFSEQLRESSIALRKYLQRVQAYNYLIDRFGRVYRIVDDETAAAHAGHGVWANGDDIYVDLNAAFLGVSFESRWAGGRALPITRAQLIAGRNLTNYLRQRFAIAPQMCVTHGLTSVSPRTHLIGYHRDWARGFPFEAFGLPDQYQRALPSVALMGFHYDQDFLRAVGVRWPGLDEAERQVAEEAREKKLSPDEFKLARQQLYDRWRKAAGDVAASDAALNSETPAGTTSK